MSRIDSLHTMFVEELRDIYDAEQRLTKAIPKLAEAATNDDLVDALESHLTETEEHVSRLEDVFKQLGVPVRGKPCAGIRGIIEEGGEHVENEFENDGLRDATIIGAAQRAEHYEMAAYGNAIAHARLLALADVAETLEATLSEEEAADEKLSEIAETVVNQEAAAAIDDGVTVERGSRRK